MFKPIFFVLFGLLTLILSESIDEQFSNYKVKDLNLIVIHGENSKNYEFSINNTESYLFIYKPVNAYNNDLFF